MKKLTMKMNKQSNVLIFGSTGQDGSYLCELMVEKGYRTIGVQRRSSTETHQRLEKVIPHCLFSLETGDVTDYHSVSGLIRKYQPSIIYNMAAQSEVGTSFEQPSCAFEINTIGVLNILEAIRCESQHSRLVQASTSEMFGNNYREDNGQKYQDEHTCFAPDSPYAISKVAAHHLVGLYRKAYGLHVSCAITYNHESKRRGKYFVTQKIAQYVAEFHRNSMLYGITIERDGRLTCQGLPYAFLELGNLDACRDWSHAKDMCEAFYLISQYEKPDDYILSSQETHSIREFLTLAFAQIGVENWEPYVRINPKHFRPIDVEVLLGISNKARVVLGWEPKYDFRALVKDMVEEAIRARMIYETPV